MTATWTFYNEDLGNAQQFLNAVEATNDEGDQSAEYIAAAEDLVYEWLKDIHSHRGVEYTEDLVEALNNVIASEDAGSVEEYSVNLQELIRLLS